MAKVLATHKVKDFNTWYPHYKNDEERRAKAGIKTLAVKQGNLDPNNVAMHWEVSDPEIVKKMVADPELGKLMREAGVVGEVDFFVME